MSRPPRFPYPDVGAEAPWAGYDAGRVMEAPVHYDWTKYVDPEGDSDWTIIKIPYDVDSREPERGEVFDYWPIAWGVDRDEVIRYVATLRREGDRRIWGAEHWTLGISRSAYWHAVLDLSGWPANELRPWMIENPENYEPDDRRLTSARRKKRARDWNGEGLTFVDHPMMLRLP